MAISATPRSVKDATRFTPTTPHATSKASAAHSSAPSNPRFSRPGAASGRTTPAASRLGGGGGSGGSATPPFGETPEQRVARLRAAHLAAKKAQVSRFDQVISGGRRFFDSAHKMTVLGLLGLTAIAGLMTVYTAADMFMYNRKRKGEFFEAQRRMAADSLEAARLAYMTGKATEDQIAMVDEANAREAGNTPGIFSAPSVLGAPAPLENPSGAENPAARTGAVSAAATWPASGQQSGEGAAAAAEQQGGKKQGGIRGWLFSSLKKEEEGDDFGSTQRRLGWESLSEEDDGAGVRESDLARALESKQARLREKAKGAFEAERENQRKGGPLDRVGIEAQPQQPDTPKKKGGWFW